MPISLNITKKGKFCKFFFFNSVFCILIIYHENYSLWKWIKYYEKALGTIKDMSNSSKKKKLKKYKIVFVHHIQWNTHSDCQFLAEESYLLNFRLSSRKKNMASFLQAFLKYIRQKTFVCLSGPDAFSCDSSDMLLLTHIFVTKLINFLLSHCRHC